MGDFGLDAVTPPTAWGHHSFSRARGTVVPPTNLRSTDGQVSCVTTLKPGAPGPPAHAKDHRVARLTVVSPRGPPAPPVGFAAGRQAAPQTVWRGSPVPPAGPPGPAGPPAAPPAGPPAGAPAGAPAGSPAGAPAGPPAGPTAAYPGRGSTFVPDRCKTRSAELREISIEFLISDLEAATEGFNESRRLGAGAYGAVYRAEMRDGSQAAIKLIDLRKLGMDISASGFEEEVAILSKFRHPNLILLMGWARTDTCRYLIYEFLQGGDVSVRLQKCKSQGGKPFPWKDRLSVSLDAATGLAYLHNATPHAYHRDIKSANILLDASGTGAKMADFGLSCISNVNRSSSSSFLSAKSGGPYSQQPQSDGQYVPPCGTPGYICPLYLSSGRITEGSEVYSFGIVFLEILLNIFPSLLSPDGALSYPIYEAIRFEEPGAAQRAEAHADATAAWPPSAAADVATLALQCIDLTESRRPSFNDVCRSIRSIQSTEREPVATEKPRRTARSLFLRKSTKEAAPAPPPAPAPAPPAPVAPAAPSPNASDASLGGPQAQAVPPGPVSELVLHAVYACKFANGYPPPAIRTLRLKPAVQASGRCVVQIGRDKQAQWFQELLIDAGLLEQTVSGVHVEIAWDGSGGGVVKPTLQCVGNLPIFLDNGHLPPGQTVPLKEGSLLKFMALEGSMKGFVKLVLSIGFSSHDGRNIRPTLCKGPTVGFEVEASRNPTTFGQQTTSATLTADTCADRCVDRCTLM